MKYFDLGYKNIIVAWDASCIPGHSKIPVDFSYLPAQYISHNSPQDLTVNLEFDISDVLRPGVYLLRLGPTVVYIGKAKCLLVGIGMHIAIRNKARLPAWFPIPRVAFDHIAIIPCGDPARLAALHASLLNLHQPLRTRSDIHYPTPPPASPLIRRSLDSPKDTLRCPSP